MEGSFQIVVDATSPDEALEQCRRRLRKLRSEKDLFDKPCKIYLEGIIRLDGSYKHGLVVNYDMAFHGDHRGHVSALVPPQSHGDTVNAYGYAPDPDTKDAEDRKEGHVMEPFLDFPRGKKAPSDPTSTPTSSWPAQRAARENDSIARDRAAASKRGQRLKEQSRKAALEATLAELGLGKK